MKSCACKRPGSVIGSPGSTTCRSTRSGTRAANMAFPASAAWVAAVAYRLKDSRSRRLSRPAAWSISAPVRMTALMGLPRVPEAGCSAGDCRTCWGRSGAALIKTQLSPSPVTARLVCVRGRARASPAHASRHVGQRQFHCGKPPPAADPKTMAARRVIQEMTRDRADLELGRQVAVDFEADADLDERRCGPGHWRSPWGSGGG